MQTTKGNRENSIPTCVSQQQKMTTPNKNKSYWKENILRINPFYNKFNHNMQMMNIIIINIISTFGWYPL